MFLHIFIISLSIIHVSRQSDVGLCSQVYLMHQYCTRQTDVTSDATISNQLQGCAELRRRMDDLEELMTWYKASDGYLYKLFRTPSTYAEARKTCAQNGGILASNGPRDPDLRREIINLSKQKGDTLVWIGATDIQHEGSWVWEDGINANNDIDWILSPKQPSNSGGGENCAHFISEHGWKVNDNVCTATMPFLCERRTI